MLVGDEKAGFEPVFPPTSPIKIVATLALDCEEEFQLAEQSRDGRLK